ncbi:Osmotin, thaumatin-like protein [Rhizodiscina lignyota]|uniref:Osmotin, thaumatin-like protein n=1 Tax=Rhizodiscina lignyota TaxID=1504668 RepID=A0A9P4IIS4_9PEZI|nr:Osmotin, thaumatin-like protein [Rhizodiscina lignyota]
MRLALPFYASQLFVLADAIYHHHSREIVARESPSSKSTVPLVITNSCRDTIWPGIETQGGDGPDSNGFELQPASQKNLSVAINWNGRVWARTNCTFDSIGTGSCGTGDCGGKLNCTGTGTAATLAEFNLPAYENQSFYDISLVDGYNLPLAIQVIPNPHGGSAPPPNNTNPSCVGSVEYLAPSDFNPYSSPNQQFLGTSSSNPLPFDSDISSRDASTWCPYDLQQNPLKDIGGERCPCLAGADAAHPPFNPCLSACSKYGDAKFCCVDKYDSASNCGPNYYSEAAKRICPDAYSYAYDDDKSTFAVSTGSGFEVVFCPGGRSTTILKTLAMGNSATSAAHKKYRTADVRRASDAGMSQKV